MPIVAQVSDLHLSPRVPARQQQAELVLAGINQANPDLTVVTGDLTDDGWDRPEDLVWAKQWMDDRLDHEWFAVPGNHDVGNFAGAKEGAITAERVGVWDAIFEPQVDRVLWCKFDKKKKNAIRTDAWALVGINSMLFGSGLPSEKRQERWLSSILDTHAGDDCGCLAVFLHSPLFMREPEETNRSETSYWLGHAIKRYDAWSTMMHDGVELVASGHVHQTKFDTIGEDDNARHFSIATRIVWAPPASGTWVHAPGLPNPPAPERTGFVLHHLGDDGSVKSEVVECAPMLKTVFFDPTGRSEQ